MSILDTYTPPPNPGDTLRRVLVIKLGAMGDFMQALGAMRVVRATHPSARITLLTTEPFDAFAKACPYFDIVEADGRPRDIKGRTDLIRRLRAANYDMVYDFQNNDRTAQYFVGLTGKKPLWSGAAKGASHQHINPERAEMHNFDRLAEQLVHAGLGPKPPGDPTGWFIGQDLTPSLDWIRPAFRDPPRFQPAFFGLNGPYALSYPAHRPSIRKSAGRSIVSSASPAGSLAVASHPSSSAARPKAISASRSSARNPAQRASSAGPICSSWLPCPNAPCWRSAAIPVRCIWPPPHARQASACSPRNGTKRWRLTSTPSGAPGPASAAQPRAAGQ
jgi:hypothetical protein